MELPENTIICGPAKEVLQTFHDEPINCCISSPPYWALRDYGVDGQLGLEPTFEEYVLKLCDIYDEVKRVLRKDGTCFVNLGDTYNNVTPGGRDINRWPKQSRNDHTPNNRSLPVNVQVKSLCLIPQRFAIEMVNRGWILRNVIIWHKPNPMPSSAKDRFTVDFEYVYFFVKSKKYWFEPQYEPYQESSVGRYALAGQRNMETFSQSRDFAGGGREANENPPHIYKAGQGTVKSRGNNVDHLCVGGSNPLGRNKRCVWTIPTQPFPEAHFATFPEKLVEPMIKAGCPEFVCTKCGKAREKIYNEQKEYHRKPNYKSRTASGSEYDGKFYSDMYDNIKTFKGYTDCGCNVDWRPGVVLDPFAGSGTTLQVAARLNRNWLGIELKPEYIEMAEKRATQGETGITVKEQQKGQQALFPTGE
jgi:DNA modification methylase